MKFIVISITYEKKLIFGLLNFYIFVQISFLNHKLKYSEEQIIVLLKQQDQDCFTYIYENYSGAIYGVIFRIVQSKEYTEEVIQDFFLKIWNSIPQYDSQKGRFFTWMINIARNTAIDYLKSKNFQNELKNQQLPDFVYNIKEDSHSNFQEESDLAYLINKLEPDKRELLQLAYYQGYTQVEISEKLKIPLGTVKTKIRTTLLKLKEILKDYQ